MDGRRPCRYINPEPHTMRIASASSTLTNLPSIRPTDTIGIVCGRCPSVCPSVCISYRPAACGGFTGDGPVQVISIDCCTGGAQQQRRTAAINAVSSKGDQCHVSSRRKRLNTDLFKVSNTNNFIRNSEKKKAKHGKVIETSNTMAINIAIVKFHNKHRPICLRTANTVLNLAACLKASTKHHVNCSQTTLKCKRKKTQSNRRHQTSPRSSAAPGTSV